jgi:hypothetical protein
MLRKRVFANAVADVQLPRRTQVAAPGHHSARTGRPGEQGRPAKPTLRGSCQDRDQGGAAQHARYVRGVPWWPGRTIDKDRQGKAVCDGEVLVGSGGADEREEEDAEKLCRDGCRELGAAAPLRLQGRGGVGRGRRGCGGVGPGGSMRGAAAGLRGMGEVAGGISAWDTRCGKSVMRSLHICYDSCRVVLVPAASACRSRVGGSWLQGVLRADAAWTRRHRRRHMPRRSAARTLSRPAMMI